MKQIMERIKLLKMYELKKKKPIIDLFKYLVVGSLATLVEWVIFYLLDKNIGLHYEISTVVAFIFSTFANWVFGRLIMFKNCLMGIKKELVSIYSVSVVGLIMNMIIMWIGIGIFSIKEMFSKIIATAIVFVWNYLIRKFVIYNVDN